MDPLQNKLHKDANPELTGCEDSDCYVYAIFKQ